MPPLPSRILALDASLQLCSAAVLVDGAVVAECCETAGRGQVQRLAPMLAQVVQRSGLTATALDLVAVGTGPGSFTGLRSALALAHGLSLAAGVRLVGVTLAEIFAAALPPLPGRALWVAIDNRRGGMFLDRGDGFANVALTALPRPDGGVAVAGDAAEAVAARLAADGADAQLTDVRQPHARDVAMAARHRCAAGRGEAEPVLPLYVDPPALRPPA